MRHKGRTILTALVAVLALGVVASASASAALPEFAPSEGAKFPITGEFKGSFTKAQFENVGTDSFYECEGIQVKDEITGAKTMPLTIEMKNCTKAAEKIKCHTAGAAEGTVKLPATGTLAYLNKATKQVGVVVKLNEVVKVLCGESEFKYKHGFVVPITPINTKTSLLDISVRGSSGKQEFSEYENEQGKVLTETLEENFGGGYLEADYSIKGGIELTTSKPLTVEG